MLDYTKVDTAGNPSSVVSRTVNVNVPVADTTPPVVVLSGSSTVSGEYGLSYVDA